MKCLLKGTAEGGLGINEDEVQIVHGSLQSVYEGKRGWLYSTTSIDGPPPNALRFSCRPREIGKAVEQKPTFKNAHDLVRAAVGCMRVLGCQRAFRPC